MSSNFDEWLALMAEQGRKKGSPFDWTPANDQFLLDSREQRLTFKEIGDHFGDRNEQDVRKRWHKLKSSGDTESKPRWNTDDVQKLFDARENRKLARNLTWDEIAVEVGTHGAAACEAKYYLCLSAIKEARKLRLQSQNTTQQTDVSPDTSTTPRQLEQEGPTAVQLPQIQAGSSTREPSVLPPVSELFKVADKGNESSKMP